MLTYSPSEMIHEQQQKPVPCPRCAKRYPYKWVIRDNHIPMQRVTDKVLMCVACGYRMVRE